MNMCTFRQPNIKASTQFLPESDLILHSFKVESDLCLLMARIHENTLVQNRQNNISFWVPVHARARHSILFLD